VFYASYPARKFSPEWIYITNILNYSGEGKGFLNKFGKKFAADCRADEPA
jgi:hypothetical protein